MIKPFLQRYPNPLASKDSSKVFDYYEIQTVRMFVDGTGHEYMEPAKDEDACRDENPDAAGPVLYGVYGHLYMVGVVHIQDFLSKQDAEELLQEMGVIPYD